MKREEKWRQIRDIIESAKSGFVTVGFIKKDGSTRMMNIQPLAIRRHILGEAASESAQKAVATRKANHPNLYNCWDVKVNGPRSINLDTVFLVRYKRDYHFPMEVD